VNIVLLIILLLIAIPVLWVAWAIFYVSVIEPYKKRTSYLVSRVGPRERGDGFSFTYYEKGKELYFFGENPENTICLPNEELWKNTMPDFFRDRYNVVVPRLKRKMGRRFSLKIVDDYKEGCSILYVDESKTGDERTIKFGGVEDSGKV
jgi:hypothetical protein